MIKESSFDNNHLQFFFSFVFPRFISECSSWRGTRWPLNIRNTLTQPIIVFILSEGLLLRKRPFKAYFQHPFIYPSLGEYWSKKVCTQILYELVRFCTSPTCTHTASKQTTVNVQKALCTYSKCIYLLLKEMATSLSLWLYGAVILYFSRLTC